MKIFLAAAALTLTGSMAVAKPPLGQQTQITEGLINVAIAYEISEVCPSIKARLLAGIGRLNGLRGKARSLGYTNDEIDAFVGNDAEQDRLEGIARARLQALGARRGDVNAHCRVGRDQIAKRTAIGTLLR